MNTPQGEPRMSTPQGIVYLVGAGPGEPGLLTVRGRDLIANADVVVYTRRAQRKLLPPRGVGGPVRYYAGARGEMAAPRQSEVQQLMVGLAREGKRVVYLADGDPFVFGGGSDTAQALHDADVDFEIVPGITAGSAASTYAGIPLMSRTLAASTIFADARKPSRAAAVNDWSAIARVGGTVVVRNAQRALPAIVAGFATAGAPGEIPAAAIGNMGRASQRVIVSTLGSIDAAITRASLSGAVTLVIGWTVLLRDELAWFDVRPLFGRRVVIAQSRHGATAVADRLRELGATVMDMPHGGVARLDLTTLREEIERIREYEWIVFASPDAVATFWELLVSSGRDTRALANARIAAIGSATAGVLLDHGVTVDVVQDRFEGPALIDVMSERSDVPGAQLLYVAGDEDAESFGRELEEAGASVTVIAVYREVGAGKRGDALRRALDAGRVDLVVALSPAAAAEYVTIAGEELVSRAPAAAYDAATASVLSEGGVEVVTEPRETGVDATVAAVRLRLARTK